MVFKVKQRAKTNYYDKIIGELTTKGTSMGSRVNQEMFIKESESMLRPEGYGVDVSYNWPYDFFSLVELVKLDAEVTLGNKDVVEEENPFITVRGDVVGRGERIGGGSGPQQKTDEELFREQMRAMNAARGERVSRSTGTTYIYRVKVLKKENTSGVFNFPSDITIVKEVVETKTDSQGNPVFVQNFQILEGEYKTETNTKQGVRDWLAQTVNVAERQILRIGKKYKGGPS
jgi:hypothetical protein